MLFAQDIPIPPAAWKEGGYFVLLIVVVFGIGWGTWKTVTWARDNVASPLVTAMITLIRELHESLPKHTKSLEDVARTSRLQADSLEEIRVTSSDQLALQKEEAKHLDEIKSTGKEAVQLAKDNQKASADQIKFIMENRIKIEEIQQQLKKDCGE